MIDELPTTILAFAIWLAVAGLTVFDSMLRAAAWTRSLRHQMTLECGYPILNMWSPTLIWNPTIPIWSPKVIKTDE